MQKKQLEQKRLVLKKQCLGNLCKVGVAQVNSEDPWRSPCVSDLRLG